MQATLALALEIWPFVIVALAGGFLFGRFG